MPDTSRQSNLYDTMNSMYYVEQDQPVGSRFIRLKGQLKVQSQEMLPDDVLDENLDKQIQINSFIAWGILFLSVILIASVPCWLMSGKIEIFTKNGWRFLIITCFLLPFLFYEQRTSKEEKQKLKNMITIEYLKPIFMSTLNFCIWFWCLVYACKFTSMNHALCLSSLKPFYLAMQKIRKRQKFHEFQVAGCFLCIIGIILVCTDSIALPMIFDNQTRKYLKTQPWKRLVFGDTIAALGTICSVYLDQNQKVPGMPRFTHMFFYNIFACFNMITFGYFFGGTDFNFHWRFGIFGMFTYDNFVFVLYPAIILGLFVMICNILAAQIFNQLVINVATCFKLIISSVIMHALGLELIMSGITILGFSFVIPGLVFIVTGQGVLQSKQHKLSFQLYRPPDIFYNPMVNLSNTNLKGEQISIDLKNQNILNKSQMKSPFEMILQEDETDKKKSNE